MFEIVNRSPDADKSLPRKALDRSVVAQAVSRLLWSQHRMEERLALLRLEDAPVSQAKPFLEAGEFITQMVLSPDLRDTALMAMADALVRSHFLDTDNPPTIFDLSRRTQRQYLVMAEFALRSYMQTLRFQSSNSHLDSQYSALLDALSPKQVQP